MWLVLLGGCAPAGGEGFVVGIVGSVADGEGLALSGAELDFLGDTGAISQCKGAKRSEAPVQKCKCGRGVS